MYRPNFDRPEAVIGSKLEIVKITQSMNPQDFAEMVMSERLEKLQKLYEMDPNDAFVTYGIAMELINNEQHEQALDWLDKTLDVDASYLYAYFQKAKVLHGLGQSELARSVVKEGIDKAQAAGDQKAFSELNDLAGMLR